MSNALRLACTSVPGNLPVMHTGAIPRAPLTRSAPNALAHLAPDISITARGRAPQEVP
jgi:hypothetical protein